MAHTGIFATALECQYKAGAGASAAAIAELLVNSFCSQAESFINVAVRYNFSDAYAGLNADVKGILTQVASDLVGIYCINYDMSGYSSGTEAESMINILRDSALRGISILRDKKQEEFMVNA